MAPAVRLQMSVNPGSKMNFFSKEEIRAIGIIFGLLIVFSAPNFLVSLRRARDAQRKADIGSVYEALNKYQTDFGTFPLSVEGKIAACAPAKVIKQEPKNIIVFSPCNWGQDSLRDLADPDYPPYLKNIPADPLTKDGFAYYYLANGSRYQIYGALEGKTEAEYDPKIVARNLPCGAKICNFGKAYGRTPLDKSIEKYENEISK